MTDFTNLALERRGAIEILSLDWPDSLNAISPEMVDEASAYFSSLYDRLDVRVVILRANGRAFSAGADLGSGAFAPSRARTAPASEGDAEALFRSDQADARLPAADHRLGSRTRLRRRLLASSRLRRALRRAKRAHERRLYPRRPRRVRHGRRLSAAAPGWTLQRLGIPAYRPLHPGRACPGDGPRQRNRRRR